MPNVQVFAWCTLSAVIGFIGGQLSPPEVWSSPPDTSRSRAHLPSSPGKDPPSPARGTSAPLDDGEQRPTHRAPSAEAVVRALARSPAVSEAAPAAASKAAPLPAREAMVPAERSSLLSSFRFAGVGPHGGVRLGRVARGSLPELLGLKTGDEIITLNGFRIAEPQQALEAYARLRYVDDWVVSLHRGGAQTEVRYALR